MIVPCLAFLVPGLGVRDDDDFALAGVFETDKEVPRMAQLFTCTKVSPPFFLVIFGAVRLHQAESHARYRKIRRLLIIDRARACSDVQGQF